MKWEERNKEEKIMEASCDTFLNKELGRADWEA